MTGVRTFKKMEVADTLSEAFLTSYQVVQEGDRLFLRGEGFPGIDHRNEVDIIGYSEEGLRAMRGIVTLSIDTQLNVDVLAYGDERDRRDHLKVRVNDRACIQRAFMKNRSEKGLIVDDEVRLRDISVGGLCFFSNRTYFVGQRLIIHLDAIRQDMVVEALILRKERERRRTGVRYRYACRFIQLNEMYQRVICEYVFRVQLEDHHREQEGE